MTRVRKILVINPNSNPQVTRNFAEALQPLCFEGGPEIDCVTLAEGPFGVETQADVDSVAMPLRALVAADNSADAFVIACYSDPGLPRGDAAAGVRRCRGRRAVGAGARRSLRRHRRGATFHRPALALPAPDVRDGPLRRRASAEHERGRNCVRRRHAGGEGAVCVRRRVSA